MCACVRVWMCVCVCGVVCSELRKQLRLQLEQAAKTHNEDLLEQQKVAVDQLNAGLKDGEARLEGT